MLKIENTKAGHFNEVAIKTNIKSEFDAVIETLEKYYNIETLSATGKLSIDEKHLCVEFSMCVIGKGGESEFIVSGIASTIVYGLVLRGVNFTYKII